MEVLFVILAIFLGLRCYVVQPFRIPTGSMQPSLNGIRAIPQEGIPSLMKKIGDMVLYGGSYVHETAQKEKKIVRFVPGTKYLLLTVTNVQFDAGNPGGGGGNAPLLPQPGAPVRGRTQHPLQNLPAGRHHRQRPV